MRHTLPLSEMQSFAPQSVRCGTAVDEPSQRPDVWRHISRISISCHIPCKSKTIQRIVFMGSEREVALLEARGGERKLAGLPVVCCWCCCWCCCCRCCAGRCCAGCSAGAGSSAAAAAAAGAGWSAAAAAAAALGMLLLLLLLVLLLLLPLLRWALQMLGVLQLLGGPAHRAQGGVEPRGGGSIRLI